MEISNNTDNPYSLPLYCEELGPQINSIAQKLSIETEIVRKVLYLSFEYYMDEVNTL